MNEHDEIEIGHLMSITLTGDHRVVDEAFTAEYMSALRKLLESPALLLFLSSGFRRKESGRFGRRSYFTPHLH